MSIMVHYLLRRPRSNAKFPDLGPPHQHEPLDVAHGFEVTGYLSLQKRA